MVSAPEDNDRVLVERWTRLRDEGAWRLLMRRYDLLVRRTLAALGLKAGEEVDDLLQDFWWEQSRTIKRWKGESSLGTYLASGARRRGIDLIRKQTRRRRHQTDTPIEDLALADTQKSHSGVDLKAVLERCYNQLESEERLLFLYREIEGWSVAETAATMGIAEGTVKSRLSRIKQKLKDMLQKEGWDARAFA